MQLTETIPLSHLLRIRPATVGLLNASGLSFWHQLDLPVEDFCRRSGLDPAAWINQVRDLPISPDDSDWSTEPLYRIMDFLTSQHREFRTKNLHNILHLLETENIPLYPDVFWLRYVCKAFQPFKRMFLAHMREEENRLFPHILRLEAFLCDPNAQSLLSEISVEAFVTKELCLLEEHLHKTIVDIVQKIREHRVEEATVSIGCDLVMELENFEKRLALHNDIETRFLFARALKMENRLRPTPKIQ